MAFAHVQSVQATASALTCPVTIAASGLNNLVVVFVKISVGSPPTTVTVTDDVGNTYTTSGAVVSTTSTVYQSYMFYGVQATGGAVTITAHSSTSASMRVSVEEYSGAAAAQAQVFDKRATNTGSGTAASVTLAPTAAGELIVAGIHLTSATSITVGTNYALGTTQTNASTEYRLSGATTSETAPLSWTTTGVWAEIAGAFRAPVASLGGSTRELMGV